MLAGCEAVKTLMALPYKSQAPPMTTTPRTKSAIMRVRQPLAKQPMPCWDGMGGGALGEGDVSMAGENYSKPRSLGSGFPSNSGTSRAGTLCAAIKVDIRRLLTFIHN